MIRRLTAAVLATAVLALLLAAAAPRAEAISFVDKQVQAGGLLIQNYVDKYGMANAFHFPPRTMVKKGGGLPDSTLMWPANPWTGKTMGAGTSRGTYTYTLAANGLSYRLTMHFSSGSYTFKGGIPRWLRSERDQASNRTSCCCSGTSRRRPRAATSTRRRERSPRTPSRASPGR